MSSELYALIALAARYWFAALIVVLLFRGWRMTVSDNRRAKLIREWMGQTGCVGEWIANPGEKKRVSYPIPREGVLGSARSADVRIRHRDIKRAHAHFELREGGLLVKPLGSARLSVGGGHTGEAVFLQNGDVLTVGKLKLMLVLFDAPDEAEEAPDEWFEVGRDMDGSDGIEDDEEGEFPAALYAAPDPAHADRRTAKPFLHQEGTGPVSRGARKPAGRRGKAAPDGAEAWFSEPAPTNRGNRAARGGSAKTRATPAGRDEFFNEDTIWRDH